MTGQLLATLGLSLASAFVPALPIEPYVVGAGALGSAALPVALTAAVGQTIGKVLILLAARGSLHNPALRRWLDRRRGGDVATGEERLARGGLSRRLGQWTRRIAVTAQRPALTVPVVLLSACVGLPPLLLITFCVAAAKTPVAAFAAACLVGRSTRFVALAMLPALVQPWL
ncbi:hypothetical protein E1193_05215 [Micromonospora sp. KC606]|uniref:hypothetical protein n=1 Tax=Micromonospora sp. KC606 TaxID=2530379 RepID=UPI001051517B|nr:hypothetical protein [Micromonospora sp. KC606]TDC84531.1 hypothetical protein E1193_05215 [Micromonospora sp. KC606]